MVIWMMLGAHQQSAQGGGGGGPGASRFGRGPPPSPAPRWRPTASISSMNTMAGDSRLAWSNRSRTRDAPTPTYSSKLGPLIEEQHQRGIIRGYDFEQGFEPPMWLVVLLLSIPT